MANTDDDPRFYDYERERGIFTPRDRKFLAGELDDELSDNQKRQKRYRLRQRMFHAIQDMVYLNEMEMRDHSQLNEKVSEKMPDGLDWTAEQSHFAPRFTSAIEAMFELVQHYSSTWLISDYVLRQTAREAAKRHYEKTGEVGVFEPELDVELKREYPLSALRSYTQAEFFDELDEQVSQEPPHAITGVRHVLDHFDLDPFKPKQIDDVGGPDIPDDAPEEVRAVVKTIFALPDPTIPAPREDVIDHLVEEEGFSESEVDEAIDSALWGGLCYETGDGLRAI